MLKLCNMFILGFISIWSIQPCYANFVAIGRYGQNGDIVVYKSDAKCVMTLLGRNRNHLPQSIILWTPQIAKQLLIFPNTSHFEIALASFKNLTPYPSKYPLIKNTLTFDNDTIALTRWPGSADETPIFIYNKPSTFIDTLIKNPVLIANLYDAERPIIHSVIQFNLDGFKDALFAADKSCVATATFGRPDAGKMPDVRPG